MLSVLGFKRGLLRSGLTHPPQKKDPAPRLWRGTRGAAKDSARGERRNVVVTGISSRAAPLAAADDGSAQAAS